MDFSVIFESNEAWVARKLATDPDYFRRLAKEQKPEILYIGCSDSRVTAEEMMGVEPGEVFIHRNVANLVIGTDTNVNAVVQFAVEQLNIKHIVVCGHYECGGIKAALQPHDLGQLNSWLQTIRDVYRLHREELDHIQDHTARYDRLVELNVLEQCLNVSKIDYVQKAWFRTGYPKIHGWVFNIRTGRLADLGLNIDEEFEAFRSIYELNYE